MESTAIFIHFRQDGIETGAGAVADCELLVFPAASDMTEIVEFLIPQFEIGAAAAGLIQNILFQSCSLMI